MTWQESRQQTLKHDEHACQYCGTTRNLHVHYLTARRLGGADSQDNLISLCRKCHKSIEHGKLPSENKSGVLRLKISDRLELLKIGARLLLKDGNDRTMEEVIHYVIAEYKKTHKDEA